MFARSFSVHGDLFAFAFVPGSAQIPTLQRVPGVVGSVNYWVFVACTSAEAALDGKCGKSDDEDDHGDYGSSSEPRFILP
jgi:hypothetical protein